jgi:outer membrane protein assembly factor BamE (lipoprotein component of BamABCDE complex)
VGKASVHRLALGIAAALLLQSVAACVPAVRDQRGYIVNERTVAAIAPSRDTRDTVLVALGTPTAIGTFHVNSWYYIGAQTETVAYRAPEVLGQQVVAILFTDDGVVEDVQRYTLADAMRVSPTARETPTRGREMGLMEQLIGNIGRFNPGAMRQTQQ